MMKKILASVALLTLALLPFQAPATTYAVDEGAKQAACEGIGVTGTECDNGEGDEQVNGLIATAVNILSWVVGIASIIMIIVGGLKYVVSSGDSNAISSAKNTVIYALVGLIIALLAQALVQFVLRRATTEEPANTPSRNGQIFKS